MKKENLVAKIIKIYAFVNEFGCIICAIFWGDSDYALISGWELFFASIVVNFSIYAFGEIIQLLHDIKLNTMNVGNKTAGASALNNAELPEL